VLKMDHLARIVRLIARGRDPGLSLPALRGVLEERMR
jgi:hypothetical protein